ncbi:hypothetical protein WOLCODRAFT_161294 [Wolfiporia cocos MD-104 SS10]|uniref:Protein OS-9 homolog n=1 Tax=Wolfiporia cocos (strain MD-104) TaxID=742152 RepID=A0A2H3J763_WOLCO|nr:hypothetical protein WOLCODRAFT_161294 [Wolfiporia cocos MD-104 SS10]
MRIYSAALSLTSFSLSCLVSARLHHSLVPEDPYAFPKYRVTFLNGLPVLNETAERWLRDGIEGGLAEFLDEPWEEAHAPVQKFKTIEGGEQPGSVSAPALAPAHVSNYSLEHMKLGPQVSYLCLIPPPPDENTTMASEDSQTDVTPVHSWSLLQPLTGTCLYHRQGWFTYSYCHNLHVRQFHELPPQHPHRPGEYQPQEDTEWESYTLGRAPPEFEAGADLTVAEAAALATNIELARGAGSRYLVQRWGDGTYCDKTGRKREIEVQFHCSMTMTDTILFVKETQTCHYVLHIATPRLCGVPGFRSRSDVREEAYIRCREVLAPDAYARADRSLPAAGTPLRKPARAKVIAPPPPPVPADDPGAGAGAKLPGKTTSDLLRRALERFIAREGSDADELVLGQLDDGDGELYIEFIELDADADGEDGGEAAALSGEALADVLRRAGYDVKGEKQKEGGKKAEKGSAPAKQKAGSRGRSDEDPEQPRRDEL